MIERFLIVAIIAIAFAPCGAGATDGRFILGVGTHFGQDRGDVDRLFDVMARSGIRAFRDEIFWPEVERTRGAYRLPAPAQRVMRAIRTANARGIDPLLILCYGNDLYGEAYPVSPSVQEAFARYGEFMARELRAWVRYFEVWNEWNGGLGSPEGAAAKTPEHYFELLRRTHAAIKRGNPDAVVVAGAVEGGGPAALAWIDRLFTLGGARYMDALSVHPYLHHGGPTANPERLAGWFERLDEILRRRGVPADLPVFVTEIGWPTHRGPLGLPEAQAADYAARTLLVLRTAPSVRGVWWYSLQDDGFDRDSIEHNFGLLTADFRPKPALRTLARISAALVDARAATRLSGPPEVWAVRLDGGGGTTIALWTTARNAVTVDLELELRADAAAVVDLLGADASTKPTDARMSAGSQRLQLRLTGSPTLVELSSSALAAVKVSARGKESR